MFTGVMLVDEDDKIKRAVAKGSLRWLALCLS